MDVLINIDVPNLDRGVAFYAEAFGLIVTRRLGGEVVELGGLPVRLYPPQKPSGSVGAGADVRRYDPTGLLCISTSSTTTSKRRSARAVAAGARRDRNPRRRMGQDRRAVRPVRQRLLPH